MIISLKPFIEKTINSNVGLVEFDGLLNVVPQYTSIVTQRPTEDNETVSDAIHNRPIKLNVDIIITNTPQNVLDSRSISNLPNVTGYSLGTSHIKKQLSILKKIRDEHSPITLETKFEKYENYFIENFTPRETEDEAIIISFNLVQGFKELYETIIFTENTNSNIIGKFS